MTNYEIKEKYFKVVLIHKIRNNFKWIIINEDEIFNESFVGYKCNTL